MISLRQVDANKVYEDSVRYYNFLKEDFIELERYKGLVSKNLVGEYSKFSKEIGKSMDLTFIMIEELKAWKNLLAKKEEKKGTSLSEKCSNELNDYKKKFEQASKRYTFYTPQYDGEVN